MSDNSRCKSTYTVRSVPKSCYCCIIEFINANYEFLNSYINENNQLGDLNYIYLIIDMRREYYWILPSFV